jgi:GT2 family glycosyltransferase
MTAPDVTDVSNVSVVVVTFNSSHVIDRCLQSLSRDKLLEHTVVVDNASADGSAESVELAYPAVTVVRLGENVGFAAGCNRGYAEARKWCLAYCLFLNPDAYLAEGCLATLLSDFTATSDLGIVSPMLRESRSGDVRYAGADLDLERMALGATGWGLRAEAIEHRLTTTGRPTGAAMLASGAAIDVVGMLNESYFLYWEEAEWALRFRAHGFGVAVDTRAQAFHESSHGRSGAGTDVFEYYVARNLLFLVRDERQLTRVECVVRATPFMARRVVESIGRDGVRSALSTLVSILTGVVDFLRGRRGKRGSNRATTDRPRRRHEP